MPLGFAQAERFAFWHGGIGTETRMAGCLSESESSEDEFLKDR
jgi:hypothetical protein